MKTRIYYMPKFNKIVLSENTPLRSFRNVWKSTGIKIIYIGVL